MYFDKPGKENTDRTLAAAAERAGELGIKELVVATTTGDTAYRALELCKGLSIICVTYHCGFKEPFQNVMSNTVWKDLSVEGVRVISATHALSGIERSVAKKHGGVYPALLIADTLKLFGQGTKVAVEVAIMAADGGALTGNDIIAIGGSSSGADTALVLKPAHQTTLFDMRIREIICKPREF
ncbi:MAG: hypothetical protein JEZ11_05820 [Desulfobacterales bacterium]|nr:hypothetical protein [Desulfobacterales bacterium]